MGLFSFFKSKPRYSEIEVVAKAYAAKQAYDRKDFVTAKKYFKEYFEMKGTGNYLRLDASDYQMRFNIVFCEFYSGDYESCVSTCAKLSNINHNDGNVYAFSALANNKLGNKELAEQQWRLAKKFGSQLAVWDTVDEVRMDGYNQ